MKKLDFLIDFPLQNNTENGENGENGEDTPTIEDLVLRNPDIKKVDGIVKEIPRRDLPSTRVPEGGNETNNLEINTDIGKITEENYDKTEQGFLYEPEDPTENPFFLQTQQVVKNIQNVIDNPIINTDEQGDDLVIMGPRQADLLNLDFDDILDINVEATKNKINAIYNTAPNIVSVKKIAKKYRIGEIPDFNFSPDENADTTKFYDVNPDVLKYIKDSILTKGGFDTYNSFEDFSNNAGEVIDEIIKKDPLVKKIFAEAEITLRSESTSKYLEMQEAAVAANGLDTPEELLAFQTAFDNWEKNRWEELTANSDYSNRAQQYVFAGQQVLKALTIPFARSKEMDLAEIDRQYKSGEIPEWWWRLKDTGIGLVKLFTKKYDQILLLRDKPEFEQSSVMRGFIKKNEKTIKELGLKNLTIEEISDKAADREYWNNLSEEEKDILQKYWSYTSNFANRMSEEKPSSDLTTGEILDGSDKFKGFKQYDSAVAQKMTSRALSIMEDERFASLLNDVDPDDSSFLDTLNNVLQQSNMLLTFTGEGVAQIGKAIKGPWGALLYGGGKIASILGTIDIIANELGSNVWETFGSRIRDRKGENYQPTIEDYIAEMEDPESINTFMNLLTVGGIVGLERLGISKALNSYKVGGKNIASLLRGEYKAFLKGLPAFAYQRELSGLNEFLTEGYQSKLSDAIVRYGTGEGFINSITQSEFKLLEATKGYQVGKLLPVVGKITQQSAIELNTAALKIADNFDLTESSPTFTNTERFFNQAIDKIKNDIKNGKISEEAGTQNIRDLSNLRNAGLKISTNIDGRSKSRLVRLLLKKTNLQDKIKKIDDKDISAQDILELAEVSLEIQGIVKKADAKESYFNQVGNILNIINNNEKANVKIIRSSNAKGVQKQVDRLNAQGWKIAASKGLTTNYGTIFQKGDQQVIILNNQEILKDGAINTAAHEFLHAVLWNTVKNSKGTALALGNDLVTYLNEVNPELMKNSALAKRIQQYKDDPNVTNEQQAEEVLTLFSEAVLDGAIEINETIGQQIAGLFTRIFETLGFSSNIRFNSGRDVFKFIKDYNASIKKGKFTKAQDKLLSERATGDLVKREYTTQEMKDRDKSLAKSSKKLGELTTEYKEGDFNNVEQLTQQYQATGRDALKRWAAQRKVPLNLSNPAINEEVTSLLNKEFNSFTRNFDPTKSEASTYMNQIAKRIGPKIVEEATRKTKQVSQDVLTEKGISPEVSVQPDIDQKQKPTGQRAKVFPNAIKAIANTITGETRAEQKALLKNDITEAILRVGTNPKAIAQYIVKKTKTPQYRKLIKDKLGVFGREQYIKNINSLFANTDFIKAIPVANIKRRFGKLFGIKQIGTTPTTRIVDGKRTDFKKQIYNIPAISQAKLNKIKEYFLAGEKRSQSLFEIIGEGIAVESMNELRADAQFMNELQNRLDFKKSNLTAQDFMQEVEFNLDKRNLEDTSLDVVKASKKRSQRSYSELGLQKIARSTMRQVGGQGSVFNYKNIKDSQKSTRRTGSIIMIHGFGKDTQGSYNYGKDGSIYKNEKEFEKDVFNTPLTEAEITLLEKFDIPLVTRRGKTYYDKSKAKNSFELGIDEQIIINGKPKSVLQLARTEQRDYRKLTGPEARKRLNNKEFDELQKAKLRVFKKLAKRIESDLKIDPALKNYWAAWLNQSNDNILHPVRSLAPVEFFETRKGKKVAEHTFPASQAATIVMNMAIEGKVNENFEFIDKDYFQGSILKTDDVKLIGEGYNYISNMPNIFFDIKNPSTWMRYVDTKVNKNNKGPININNIIVKKNGKVVTLAESFGLKLDTKNQTIDNIFDQNNLLFKVFTEKLDIKEASKQLKAAIKVNNKSSVQVKNNKKTLFSLINNDGTTDASIKAMKDADITMELGNKASKKRKGISVFDFDDTLAYSKSKVIVNMPDGSIKKITPAEFAIQSETLQEQGAEFDFSEFNKVIKGKKGPLADLALKRQEKFGSGDIFVLTARPQVSALSIKTFLDGIGLNIPIENITGLENGSPDAKALWVLSKTAQGYNDFYFADDALPNVQAVKNILDQVDVKSEVQQAKANKKRNLDKEFNTIIEQQSGKKWYKTYSRARAKTTGRKVGTFEFFIPPSAEDFSGLLYKILPKGEKGNLAKKWFKDNLFDPFNEAEQEIISSKISVANDFQALRKNINNIPKNLNKPVGVGNFTHSQALRVYIWNMQGMEIPGLSTRDLNRLVEKIENNADLKVFAEKIAFIQKDKQYPKPGDNWVAGNITSDIIQNLNKAGRKEALQRWQENVDIIFSDKNLNKLEALYGSNFILALKNSLGRMKSGSNRPIGMNPQVNNLLDWLNNSVGAVMFLNMRSATLQLISSVNFLNWSDNNPVAAARAFANQKQYWSDVMTLLNSDYLVQRRNGLKINVAESEIAEAARKGGMKGTIAYLLNKGFVLTRFADSMAIATGGASFYRNRVNALLKQVNIDTGNVYTKAEAEAKAFDDFYQISEESQQSSRTDRISMQQASSIGRLILNFANTPMQYARIMKKSALDLANGRGDWKTNLSKIAYYGFVQNLIFNAMQQAVFALAFGSDDEEERTAEDRAGNIANGMVDSILRGLGYGGAAVATVKDVIIKLTQQGAKKNPKYEDAVSEVFNFSPAIDSKVRKLRSAAKTFSWNRKEIKSRGFNLDNPAYLSIAQIVSATTNIPLDRAARIMMNLKQAVDKDTEIWQRVSLMFGYSGWELGLPYWGLQTTIDKEKDEDEAVKTKYKNEANKLKTKGYKRIPMTKGKPDGKLNVDFIQVARPTGDLEYWLMPKK